MTRQRARMKAMEEDPDCVSRATGTASSVGMTANRQTSCDASMIDASPSSSGRLSHVTKSGAGKSLLMKKDVTLPGNHQNDGQSAPAVQLVQLGTTQTGVVPATTSAMNNTSGSSQATNPTSLIFNLSQFQSGNGTVLILNSSSVPASQTRTTLQGSSGATVVTAENNPSITAPVTLVYSRPPNGDSSSTIDHTSHKLGTPGMENRSDPVQIKSHPFQAFHNSNEETTSHQISNQYKTTPGLPFSSSSNQVVANVDATNGNIFDCSDLQASSAVSQSQQTQSQQTQSQQTQSQQTQMETSFSGGNCVMKSLSSNHSSLSESPSNRSDSIQLNSGSITSNHSPFMRSESSGSLMNSHQQQQRNINYNVGGSNKTSSSCHPSQQQHISNSTNPNHNGPTNNRYYTSSSGPKLVSNSMDHHHNQTDSDDMNPMDFIDNDISTPDENLFNLEAFEMLTDLPNLEDLNTSTNNLFQQQAKDNQHHSDHHHHESNSNAVPNSDYRSTVPQIADYSPDWSYPEGGMKVLVAGPWTSPTLSYSIIFDGMSVPTSLVQNGVLRCFSPAHEPGYVSLQVCIEGNIVSNSVIFEYRDHPATPIQSQCTEDYFSIDGEWSVKQT